MSLDPRRVQAIFLEAIECSPADRSAFLASACEGNPELVARIEALIQTLDLPSSAERTAETIEQTPAEPGQEPTGLFATPIPRGSETVERTPTDPTTLGLGGSGPAPLPTGTLLADRYRLIDILGEGGMGTVYRADQLRPVKREVAIKLVKPGMDSRTILARFEAERQALALMDHPNIARVFDAGTTDRGLPYFVMELVQGLPLTQYCDDHKLSVPRRLNLFVAICQAVQHAHQKGVIHRDLKPSNVLVVEVDGKPVPKVIDFGLAKALQPGVLDDLGTNTAFGSILGTPLYMAPEQAEPGAADVDTRADVYSLGVILYELLTGTTPVARRTAQRAALGEVLRLIREVDPPTPARRLLETSTAEVAADRSSEPFRLAREVRGELDWVTMRCLEKDRTRRYETANALAADVLRYLANEPVAAGPPSRWYKGRKFLRRNRAAVTAAALVLGALIGGVASTTWGLLRAVAAEGRAVVEQDKTKKALERVTLEQKKTKDALKAETEANTRTRDALESLTDTVVETTLAARETPNDDDKRFLRRILDLYDGMTKAAGNSPSARRDRADAYKRVGSIYESLGDKAAAEKAVRTSLDLAEALASEFPDIPAYRDLLARVSNDLGQLCVESHQSSEAMVFYRKAIALNDQLLLQEPRVRSYRSMSPEYVSHLAITLEQQGRLIEAEAAYDRANGEIKQLLVDEPSVARHRDLQSRVVRQLSELLMRTNRIEKGTVLATDSVRIAETRLAQAPQSRARRAEMASVRMTLSGFYQIQGQLDAADTEQIRALADYVSLAKEFPTILYYQDSVATCHERRATLAGLWASTRGDFTRIDSGLVDAGNNVLIRERIASSTGHPADARYKLALAILGRADLYRKKRDSAAAYDDFDVSLRMLRALVDEAPKVQDFRGKLSVACLYQSRLLIDRQDFANALPLLEESDQLMKALINESPANKLLPGVRFTIRLQKAAVLEKLIRFDDAANVLKEGMREISEAKPSDSKTVYEDDLRIHLMLNLARLLQKGNHPDESREQCRQLVVELGRGVGNVGDLDERWRDLGWLWVQLGDAGPAMAAFQKAIPIKFAMIDASGGGVTDFRFLQDVPSSEFVVWTKGLPSGFRPIMLAARPGVDPPRFDALAVNDGTNLPFELSVNVPEDQMQADFDAHVKVGLRNHWSCFSQDQGQLKLWRIWVKNDITWFTYTSKRLDLQWVTEKKANQQRPTSLTVTHEQGTEPPTGLGATWVPSGGLDWEIRIGLSGDELAAAAEEARGRGWRVDGLVSVPVGSEIRFDAVLIANPGNVPWEFRRGLAPAAFTTAVEELRGRKLRPHAIAVAGSVAAPLVTCAWVGFELEADNRKRANKVVVLNAIGVKVRDLDPSYASDLFRLWSHLTPGDFSPIRMLAEIFEETARWKELVEVGRTLEAMGDSWGHNHLALGLLMTGAVEEGEKLVGAEQSGYEKVLMLAYAGQSDRARAALLPLLARDAKESTPGSGSHLARVGSLIPSEEWKPDEAVRYARKHVAVDGKSPWVRYALAMALLRSGLPAEAEAELVEANRLDPNWAPGTVLLARSIAAHDLGRFDDARRLYDEGCRRPERPWNLLFHFLEYHILRREAARLFEPPAEPRP